ncbi:hypothetical protein [Streptomyces jumonjinensis]|uniref:Uncharacterized protein n=1 Tax=Streptomyces jumonjinensis TaxID=1945 RepID=A0A646KNN1_STRJU|nr:hypothetical protein [Streptomyces jumonjinensis]MQT03853.1 hypothetical protein [Streptomyces jumonjinensis]
MQWLSGMRITADRLNDATPVALTSTVVPAAGFTLTNFTGRKSGGVVEFSVTLTRSGADLPAASASGNIGDVTACVLPPDCRPVDLQIVQFDKSGVASGSVRISAGGGCNLTSMDPTSQIQTGNSVNFSGAFVTG